MLSVSASGRHRIRPSFF